MQMHWLLKLVKMKMMMTMRAYQASVDIDKNKTLTVLHVITRVICFKLSVLKLKCIDDTRSIRAVLLQLVGDLLSHFAMATVYFLRILILHSCC